MPARPNVVRRAIVWWFRPPNNPFVTVNFAVDATASRAYLSRLATGGRRVTLTHLVAATIARTLTQHPYANGRVVGQRIVLLPNVGIAMPVNLLGSDGLDRELSMASVENVDGMTLAALAEATTKRMGAEREGKPAHPLIKSLIAAGEALPHSLFRVFLHGLDTAANMSHVGDRVFRMVGVTTALSNVGSTIRGVDGVLFRGADVQPPSRLLQVGTFWGTSTIQDEVVPIGGKPTVRPMLPVLFLFDHRLLDGVRGSRMIQTFCATMLDPEAAFGPEAERLIGQR